MYLIVFSLLHKKGFSIVPELHVQIHRFSVDLHIHLEDRKKRSKTEETCSKASILTHLKGCISAWLRCFFKSPHHFLPGAEDAHLAEANVERRALQRAIGLFHHNDVDAAGEGGRVESSVELFDLDEHLACQLAHVVHGLAGLLEEKGERLFSDRDPTFDQF